MIRVNSVSPGNTYFDGGIWQWIENNNPELFKQALDLNPTGRMATAEEVARGVVFLASPASSFTTGTSSSTGADHGSTELSPHASPVEALAVRARRSRR